MAQGWVVAGEKVNVTRGHFLERYQGGIGLNLATGGKNPSSISKDCRDRGQGMLIIAVIVLAITPDRDMEADLVLPLSEAKGIEVINAVARH